MRLSPCHSRAIIQVIAYLAPVLLPKENGSPGLITSKSSPLHFNFKHAATIANYNLQEQRILQIGQLVARSAGPTHAVIGHLCGIIINKTDNLSVYKNSEQTLVASPRIPVIVAALTSTSFFGRRSLFFLFLDITITVREEI